MPIKLTEGQLSCLFDEIYSIQRTFTTLATFKNEDGSPLIEYSFVAMVYTTGIIDCFRHVLGMQVSEIEDSFILMQQQLGVPTLPLASTLVDSIKMVQEEVI